VQAEPDTEAPMYRPLQRRTLSASDRARRLADAGYNIWRLEPSDVELDLSTDVPHWSCAHTEEAGRRPDLDGAAEAVFGPAHFIATQCGRAAEYALAMALAKRKAPQRLTVLGHGLFITTERAFRLAGASIEIAPRASVEGVSDPDLSWLEERLRRGDVDVVCLEPSNSSLAGWPLRPDTVRVVGELCRNAGAALVLDATRLLGNAVALGAPVFETAREICRHADAFTLSCGKEFLVASGGLVGVRDAGLRRECFELSWNLGLGLEPLRLQWELFRGMRAIRADSSPLAARRAALLDLAARLRGRGLPVLEPVAGHAVFVRAGELAEPGREHGLIALEASLYERSGVRARIGRHPLLAIQLLRLTWPIMSRVEAADLDAVAGAVEALFQGAADVPVLGVDPSREALLPLFTAYRPAGR
jgi:tryptophanase